MAKKFQSFWLGQMLLSVGKYFLLFLLGLILTVSELLIVLFYSIFFFLRALFVFRSAEALYRYFARAYSFVARRIFNLQVRGEENIPQNGGFVATLRYKSINDIPLVITAFQGRQLVFWARKDVFRLRLIPYIREYVVFIDKENSPKETFRVFRRAVELLQEGKPLVVFPEGSRKEDGKDIKPGALRLARKTGVPLLPIRIEFKRPIQDNSQNSLLQSGKQLFSRTQVNVKIGKPLTVEELMDKANGHKKARLTYKDPRTAEFLLEEVIDQV